MAIDLINKNANFNDIIDERYEKERKEVKKNLNKLDHVIRAEPKVFEFSFKRSLVNHIKERKKREEEEIENQLRKIQQ
jgi:CO dehydrogenase nickel-insertion accessory protein CooC1